MSATYIWTIIVGMALANFVVRFAPMALVSRMRLPVFIERWLSFIPVSVMAALVVGGVLRPEGAFLPPFENPYLAAALPTAFIYHRTRSFLGATVAGVLFFLAFRWLMG